MKSPKPMPMIKPGKPSFSTEDEMYGKKMGQMPKPVPQKGMTRKMAPGQMSGRKPASKRDALMNRLKGMGK